MAEFALRGNRVLTEAGIGPAIVVINDGLIVAVQDYSALPDCPVEDVGDDVLMPGLVDCHVHINEPGRTDWEGFATATRAAAAGGITTLVDMPLNCIPVTTSKAALAAKLEAVGEQLWVDCGFWGGVTPDSIDNLDDLLGAGVLGVKSFLIDSGVDEFPPMGPEDLRRAMPLVAKHGLPYLVHAEYAAEPESNTTMAIGSDYNRFLASRPDIWEIDAIALMVELATELKSRGEHCRVHIVHLSSARALDLIADAKAAGIQLTVETCPHYLTLCAENVEAGNTLFKCCPPIRANNNRTKLWQAVMDGTIDFIVSDHSPCTPDLKCLDTGDIGDAWGGISALQFGLPLIWTEAEQLGLSLLEVSHLMSAKPADFIGLGHVKGRIREGCQADFLLFDDSTEVKIDISMIRHKHKITPYLDKKVRGKIRKTWLRGSLVYDEDSFPGSPTGRPLLAGQH